MIARNRKKPPNLALSHLALLANSKISLHRYFLVQPVWKYRYMPQLLLCLVEKCSKTNLALYDFKFIVCCVYPAVSQMDMLESG